MLACLSRGKKLSPLEEPVEWIGGQPGSRTLNLASEVEANSFVRFISFFLPEPYVQLSLHTALQKLDAASCTPFPCLKHYPEHLSTMGAPSPCILRCLGDP